MNGNRGETFNEQVSFFIYTGNDEEAERLYEVLAEEGKVLFPLAQYPWARKYAWVQDRFGIHWQIDADEIRNRQKIVPCFLLVNDDKYKIRALLTRWQDIFESKRLLMEIPMQPSPTEASGALQFAQIMLHGFIVNVMSSPGIHETQRSSGISLAIACKDQQEIDRLWEQLSEGGEEQACGWLQDAYGISWQILPENLNQILFDKPSGRQEQKLNKFMKMKKIVWSDLIYYYILLNL
jgi:predicted 3-demethylubiquinone-9 3-methyltransferase (glyoxalase superfamily)